MTGEIVSRARAGPDNAVSSEMVRSGDKQEESSVGKSTYPKSKGDRRRGKYFVDISNKDFVGDTPEIGCVVGLKSEKITAKVQFDTFRDKVSEFILKELTNGMDIVDFVKEMKDPTQNFVNTFLPKNLTTSERNDPIKKGLFDQKLKKYVGREYQMYDNKVKLYTYIWGQCSSGIKSIVMGEREYEEKHGKKDVIWQWHSTWTSDSFGLRLRTTCSTQTPPRS